MTPEELGKRLAFPADGGGEWKPECGLNIREHFAAMAMQGLLANPAPGLAQGGCNSLAVMAVHAADALLTELARAAK